MSEIPSTVGQIMIKDAETVSPETNVRSAIKIMAEKNIGALIVVKSMKPIGIFTERDVLTRCRADWQIPDVPVLRLMSSPVTTVTPDTAILKAFMLMHEKKIRRLPVVKNENLVGIVIDKTLIDWVLRLLHVL
ncbi:MAG: CBS domain-containing protein [Thaumarchaeota archaeon]|nr:CBS domain-containing protein [Nitrososphaerota archaeon]